LKERTDEKPGGVLQSPFKSRLGHSIYRKGLDVDISPPPRGGLKGEALLSLTPIGRVIHHPPLIWAGMTSNPPFGS